MSGLDASRPYVVVHTAVSLDGATTGFEADVGRYYELAGTWDEDVTLSGADTVLAQEPALRGHDGPGPAPAGPLLAVVDGRRRVREWAALRNAGYWSDVLALRCAAVAGPAEAAVEELVVGTDRVDLAAALQQLGRREGVRLVRVDSGGGLTGALLAHGLVDEISLLVHPVLSDVGLPVWHGARSGPGAALETMACDRLGGLVWLRYRVTGPTDVHPSS